jgi:hypothetical protein
MTKHDDWLRAAENVRSFRQMYALSIEIADAAEQPQLRDAAVAVVKILKRVMDKPIASAQRLREAQRKFDCLKSCCAHMCRVGRSSAPACASVSADSDGRSGDGKPPVLGAAL